MENREIKFRIWRDGKITQLHEMHSYSKYSNCFQKSETYGVLMQYTGLKDKKGKEVYEGDIYHMGDPKILYKVIYKSDGFIGNQIGNKSLAGLTHWQDKIEVIGNIFSNPELINN